MEAVGQSERWNIDFIEPQTLATDLLLQCLNKILTVLSFLFGPWKQLEYLNRWHKTATGVIQILWNRLQFNVVIFLKV